jgi:hypothetical protein
MLVIIHTHTHTHTYTHIHTHTHTHTQQALIRVIKTEEATILYYSTGLPHSVKLTVDLGMAGTIWLVIKEGCVKKRSSFVWRGGCNPHFGLLALPNLGTFLRDHKFYSYDVYKNCCSLLAVFSDFTSRHIFAKRQLERAINYVYAKVHGCCVCCSLQK